jgi:GT2 family glycosyltransferase/glycosyltransferase involved in cell wall biosynthesis
LSADEPGSDLARLIDAVAQSAYFDPDYYRAQHPELVHVEDLVRHYIETGWRERLNPGPAFDTASYLDVNPDVRAAEMNPLVHYILYGRAEGRLALGSRREPDDTRLLARAVAPSPQEWAALPPRTPGGAPAVDVIVPVFDGYAETLRCIYSVLAAAVETEFEVWVVDDASPNRPLAEALRQLAAAQRINLFRNPENRGFVRSCNFAMRLHPGRDVVLLNADTEVFAGWLDRLRAAALQPNVGTVTPFSNNAEICSYPRFLRNNDRRLELSDAELDRVFASVNAGRIVDLPTAVGFCMYLRRECLATVGAFDERFGLGYGEENDFSLRAARLGWRNVLAADVFVRHYGGVSFGASKYERVHAAGRVIAELHSGYAAQVRGFIASDPVKPFRAQVDAERIRRWTGGRTFLFVTHMRGGGTERHVNDLVHAITADGGGVLFCRPEQTAGAKTVQLSFPPLDAPNLPPVEMSPGGLGAFCDALLAMGVVHVHLQHLADFPSESAEFFRIAAARLRVPYDVTIHDYLAICPRITLIDASGYYCGEPDEDGCARCLAQAGPDVEATPIWLWRARFEHLLRDARAVFVPDADVATRLRRYIPSARYVLRPHPEPPAALGAALTEALAVPRIVNGAVVRKVGLVGAIAPHKGSRLLAQCARLARDRNLPLAFTVLGFTDIDEELRELGVTITGRYREEEAEARLARAQLDFAWYPSVWPETYCYALSIALRAGVFPVAFDLGAIAARLRALRWGHLMPIEWLLDPAQVVEAMVSLRVSPPPHGFQPVPPSAGGSFVEEYYDIGVPAR